MSLFDFLIPLLHLAMTFVNVYLAWRVNCKKLRAISDQKETIYEFLWGFIRVTVKSQSQY